MKNKFLLSLLFLYCLPVFSQGNLPREAVVGSFGSNLNVNSLDVLHKVNVGMGKVDFASYLFDNWNEEFVLIKKNGESKKLSSLNYNLVLKTLELKISNDSVLQVDLQQLDYIVHLNRIYKIINTDVLSGIYFEVFKGKTLRLYKETKLLIDESEVNPLLQEKIKKEKYIRKFVYYIMKDDKYEKISLGKKDILKFLNDKVDLVKVYVSNNNLSYKTDEDINKILTYYDTL
jgi:hypothetical protein